MSEQAKALLGMLLGAALLAIVVSVSFGLRF